MQAARLLSRLREEPSLEMAFCQSTRDFPASCANCSRSNMCHVRHSIHYVLSLLARVHKYDGIHVFSASYFSFVLAPTPAILAGRLYGKKVLLNYHSGEAEDHLQRWRRSAIPTIRLVDSLVVPSVYLEKVFASFGYKRKRFQLSRRIVRFRERRRYALSPVEPQSLKPIMVLTGSCAPSDHPKKFSRSYSYCRWGW